MNDGKQLDWQNEGSGDSSDRVLASSSHRLTAVGLGPGDPELITLKGLRAIEAADVIFVPRSKSGEQSLALRIAQPWVNPAHQRIVELGLPMTKDAGQLVPAWQAAADEIATQLGDGERGVYLLLGDPLLYGTWTYIWRELSARYPQIGVTVVPGITSFAAAAAATGTVLGTTDERIAIVPASSALEAVALRQLLDEFATIVLMKVGSVLPPILAALDELSLLDSAIYVERIGMPEERIVRDVRALRGQVQPYLSLLIVRP